MAETNVKEATASTIISFAEKLEDNSSRFYRKMAERYPEDREIFLAFAKESEKNKVLVIRTYQETITDAIEAGFSFKGLNLSDYSIKIDLSEEASYLDALKAALELEKKAKKFYVDMAEQSSSLLATIPRAFRKVAEIRDKRMLKLKSLIDRSE